MFLSAGSLEASSAGRCSALLGLFWRPPALSVGHRAVRLLARLSALLSCGAVGHGAPLNLVEWSFQMILPMPLPMPLAAPRSYTRRPIGLGISWPAS